MFSLPPSANNRYLTPISPLFQLHLIVVLFAITGILAPFMTLQAPSLVFWRTLIAAGAMGTWLALSRPATLRLAPRDAAQALGVGAIIALHWICFFAAIELANVSVALVGFAATSVFTAITEPLIDRRPVRPTEILLGLIVGAGLVMIIGFEHNHLLGLGVALFCAVLAAIFPVLNHRLVNRGLSSRTLLVYEMSGAAATAFVVAIIAPPVDFQFPILTDWLPLVSLALSFTVFAHTLHIHLLRKLSAYTANLAINFEPVYGIVLAALVFNEHHQLHPGFYLGALTIVVANIIQPILEKRRRNTVAP